MTATSVPEVVPERKTSIRWMMRRDLHEVMPIERASFDAGWTEDDFYCHMREKNCIGMVAESDHKVVGFMVYRIYRKHLLLINFAVDPTYRRQGVGHALLKRLQEKLTKQERDKIIVLLPESHREAASFFDWCDNVEVKLTGEKGTLTVRPVLSAMTPQDADDVQALENSVLFGHSCPARNIRGLLAKGSCYGIVARDEPSRQLLGFALYGRDSKGLTLDGQFGVIVHPEYRKRGVGRRLWMELVNQHLLFTLESVDLCCDEQCGFLEAMGVPVPEPERFKTIEWKPQI